MDLTQKELGQRLKQARESKQINQEEAAKELGLSRAFITQAENGLRPINTLQLSKLAKLYGREMGDFFRPTMNEKQSALVLFRITEDLKQTISQSAFDKNITLLREYTNLEKLLNLDMKVGQPIQYDLPSPQTKWDAIEMGQETAEKERRRLQLGTSPISSLAELLELQGIRVLEMDMDAGISGLYMSGEDTGLTVFINPKHHNFRHSFTLAHEYCHVLTDRSLKSVISSDQLANDLIEVRANSFAAGFLMPRQGVEEFLKKFGKAGPTREFLAMGGSKEGEEAVMGEMRKPSSALKIQLYDVVHLQNHYGVSWETAIYRLLNLHIITKDECGDFLERKDQAAHLRQLLTSNAKEPPADKKRASRDFRESFLSLCLDAFRQEIISYRKLEELAELIDIDFKELKELLLKLGYVKR